MRKFIRYLIAFIMVCLCMSPICIKSTSFALENNSAVIDNNIRQNLATFLNASKENDYNRVAGSSGEYSSAKWLSQCLNNYNLQAKNHAQDSTIMESQAGIQEFTYYDEMFYEKRISHNVIYTIKGASDGKKVVLSTNYDNLPYDYESDDEYGEIDSNSVLYFSQGINASASSVAVLLSLAQMLPQSYFDFDIDIVFFGAGYQDNAGAKYYNQTLSKTERENTILMLDISRIGLGERLYYYSGEFSNNNSFYASALDISRYKNSMHGASTLSDSGLGYTSAGYSSSTQVFEGNGINVLHIFAGAYDSKAFGGFCEYSDQFNITNTSYDNLDYISKNHSTDVTKNMTKAVMLVQGLLDNEQFTSTLSKKPSTWQYELFNVNSIMVITVLLILLIIVCLIIHYVLEKKARKYALDNRVDGVMIQIDEPETKTDNKEINK